MPQVNILPIDVSQPTDGKGTNSSYEQQENNNDGKFSTLVEQHLDNEKSGKTARCGNTDPTDVDSTAKNLSQKEQHQSEEKIVEQDNNEHINNDESLETKKATSNITSQNHEELAKSNNFISLLTASDNILQEKQAIDGVSNKTNVHPPEICLVALTKEEILKAELAKVKSLNGDVTQTGNIKDNYTLKPIVDGVTPDQMAELIKESDEVINADKIGSEALKTKLIESNASVRQRDNGIGKLPVEPSAPSAIDELNDVDDLALNQDKNSTVSTKVNPDIIKDLAKDLGKELTKEKAQELPKDVSKEFAKEFNSERDKVVTNETHEYDFENEKNISEVVALNKAASASEPSSTPQIKTTDNKQNNQGQPITPSVMQTSMQVKNEASTMDEQADSSLDIAHKDAVNKSGEVLTVAAEKLNKPQQREILTSTKAINMNISAHESKAGDIEVSEHLLEQDQVSLNNSTGIEENVRKTSLQNQDALIAKQAQVSQFTQVSAEATKVVDQQISAQSLEAISEAVVKENIQVQKSNTAALQETISIHRKDFADAVKDKVMVMISQKLQQFDIQLDPPELGNMHIRVNLQNEQAAVNFIVQNQQAKEAIEQNIHKLKEMLAENGVDVGDANIEQQAKQSSEENDGSGYNQQSNNGFDDETFNHADTIFQTNLAKGSATGVDYYA